MKDFIEWRTDLPSRRLLGQFLISILITLIGLPVMWAVNIDIAKLLALKEQQQDRTAASGEVLPKSNGKSRGDETGIRTEVAIQTATGIQKKGSNPKISTASSETIGTDTGVNKDKPQPSVTSQAIQQQSKDEAGVDVEHLPTATIQNDSSESNKSSKPSTVQANTATSDLKGQSSRADGQQRQEIPNTAVNGGANQDFPPPNLSYNATLVWLVAIRAISLILVFALILFAIVKVMSDD